MVSLVPVGYDNNQRNSCVVFFVNYIKIQSATRKLGLCKAFAKIYQTQQTTNPAKVSLNCFQNLLLVFAELGVINGSCICIIYLSFYLYYQERKGYVTILASQLALLPKRLLCGKIINTMNRGNETGSSSEPSKVGTGIKVSTRGISR